MSKTFKDKKEFIQVIRSIAKDGSVIMDLNGGSPAVPEEKLYPFVAEAEKMDLETAIDNLPTALRFDLIKEGYEFLLEGLDFSQLDGSNDYWPGRMTSYLLRKFPQYESRLDWSKLKNTWLAQVLMEQPQFADKVDFSKLDAKSFADLISKHPEFADKFDFQKLNTPESAQFWYRLLAKQPQFAQHCDWTLINDHQKKKLSESHPEMKIG